MSYLHHPNTTVLRPGPSYRVHERTFTLPLCGGVKASKSAPYTDYGLHLAGFDISSIDTHHGTPNEPSRLSGYDGDASCFTFYRWVRTSRRGRETVKISPAHTFPGYILRVLTSDPSNHVPRRLLSYLDHQKTAVSRPGSSYRSPREHPARGCETVKISPIH